MSIEFSQLPPEERALRFTALLLDELSAEEAEQVRQAIAADAELAREFERFRQTIELIRETSAMERKVSTDGTPLRLDDSRRQKLLETFKQPAPRVEAPRRRRWYVPASIAAALVGLLMLALMLPGLARSKARMHRITMLPMGDEPTHSTLGDEQNLLLRPERFYPIPPPFGRGW
jgi:anti-sigma factor RsiW